MPFMYTIRNEKYNYERRERERENLNCLELNALTNEKIKSTTYLKSKTTKPCIFLRTSRKLHVSLARTYTKYTGR